MGVSLVMIKSDGKMVGGKRFCPLYLQYKYKGSYKRFSTRQFIEERFWKSGVISNRCPKYNDISKRISSVRSKLEEVITEIMDLGGVPTPSMVKEKYDSVINVQNRKQNQIQGFWKSYEEFLTDKSRHHRGYTKTLITLKNTLQKFEKETKVKVSFDYVNFGRFESDFKNYCLDIVLPQRKGNKIGNVGLSNNYVNKILSNLKIFLSWCKSERIINDFKKFKVLKIIRNDVLVYLNTNEVKKMFDFKDFDYPNVYDDVIQIVDYDKDENKLFWNNLELVKDIFTFQCSVGCRWGDIHKMSVGMFKIEKGFFVWTMDKTKDSVIVPENPISLGIFKKYSKGKSLNQKLFPKYSQTKFNKNIKKVGKVIGFKRLVKREIMVGSDLRKGTEKDVYTYELLSSHSGRRSFIKNLIDLGTMDNWSIMKLSGHKTMNSFQKYVSVNKEDIKKGRDLYTKEFDDNEDKEIKEFIRKYPMERVLPFYLKYK